MYYLESSFSFLHCGSIIAGNLCLGGCGGGGAMIWFLYLEVFMNP